MRSIEGNGDVVFDQRSLSDLSYRDGAKRVTGFLAHPIIACSADHQVAFLERVGERKDLSKRLAVHVEASCRILRRRRIRGENAFRLSQLMGLEANGGSFCRRQNRPACYSRPVWPADPKGARAC